MSKWKPHRTNRKPPTAIGRIDIRTRDGFEVSHSSADYPHWTQTGGRDDIVAWRMS